MKWTVTIRGVVQGVGFRPFIDRLAKRFSLKGEIRNTAQGVLVHLAGADIAPFLDALQKEAPPLSVIEDVSWEETPDLPDYADFSVAESRGDDAIDTLLPADAATCPDCLREMNDPRDRRYRHPFINCTNCGPRFTIIRSIPYDRKATAMAEFPMCPDCAREFFDPASRRYHAQPVCCPNCGPRLFLTDGNGNELDGDPVEAAQNLLAAGKILAVKGLGGFHLAALAEEETALELRKRKHRGQKPLAVMFRDLDAAKKRVRISDAEETLLTSPQAPIVLCEKKDRTAFSYLSENGELGVFLPYTPIHHLLFSGADYDALIMTSANESDLPMEKDNAEAVEDLRGIADFFLLHDRAIDQRCDDSVLRVIEDEPYFVRRSRGYVPRPIPVPDGAAVFAAGAEEKASFCYASGTRAFLSAHIGDLKNAATYRHYEEQAAHLERLFGVTPGIIACDLHPDYLSARAAERTAKERGLPLIPVQHHHAHMASCMADNGLSGEVLGVIFDGTGYGTDGTIWGGEFLSGGYGGFTRRGSIAPFPLAGGDLAAREPLRCAASLLFAAGETPTKEMAKFLPQLEAGINCPVTTSVGRLFDGMAALCGICTKNTYDARAAILLEHAAAETDETYPARLKSCADRFLLNTDEMLRFAAADAENGVPAGIIAAKFMNHLAEGAALACERMRGETGLSRVVLSGGVFQNQYLLLQCKKKLTDRGFTVFVHRRIAPNDEGIAAGQAMIARILTED